MGDLSRILGVPFSTATRTTDWLVNNGYVQRLADPEDRRVVCVELTKTGKELYRAINDLLLESAEQFLSQFLAGGAQGAGPPAGQAGGQPGAVFDVMRTP